MVDYLIDALVFFLFFESHSIAQVILKLQLLQGGKVNVPFVY